MDSTNRARASSGVRPNFGRSYLRGGAGRTPERIGEPDKGYFDMAGGPKMHVSDDVAGSTKHE